MRDKIDVVITSASCGYYKSRPEIYWTALQALGASVNQTAHVGDSLRFDVGGARAAGMRAAWYDRRGLSDPLLSEFAPDLVFTEMATASPGVLELTVNGASGESDRRSAGRAK
jgi:FMN phosphatase YigB (HAD superfamily)